MWCLVHKLELSVKDALKGTTFAFIDEMLLCLYYIYKKSPKMCRELDDVVLELKKFIEFDDACVRLVRAGGSRWVLQTLSNEVHSIKVWCI